MKIPTQQSDTLAQRDRFLLTNYEFFNLNVF